MITKKIYGNKAVLENPEICILYLTKPIIKEASITEEAIYVKDSYFSDRDIERTDPALIQVVEELKS